VTLKTAAIKDASRREDAVAKRPSLTAAASNVFARSGRDGETALSRTKKHLRTMGPGRFYPHKIATSHNFYQNADGKNGDYGDWALGGSIKVQNASTFADQVSNVTKTSPESVALQAIGYEPITKRGQGRLR
jgi:hypothetical protein